MSSIRATRPYRKRRQDSPELKPSWCLKAKALAYLLPVLFWVIVSMLNLLRSWIT